jgi:hypothetical protein
MRRIAARIVAFARNLLRRTRVDQDLDDELRAYAAGLAEEKMWAGMSPRDAERAARLELGGFDVVKEGVRDVRTGALFDAGARCHGWRQPDAGRGNPGDQPNVSHAGRRADAR